VKRAQERRKLAVMEAEAEAARVEEQKLER
jgi:hypothetical protein